jgi:hypothetical protein
MLIPILIVVGAIIVAFVVVVARQIYPPDFSIGTEVKKLTYEALTETKKQD